MQRELPDRLRKKHHHQYALSGSSAAVIPLGGQTVCYCTRVHSRMHMHTHTHTHTHTRTRTRTCTHACAHTHTHQVKLTDSLMSSVVFSQARDSELAWVDGNVHFSSAVPSGFKGHANMGMVKGEGMTTPVLDALPHHQVSGSKTTCEEARLSVIM